MLLGVILGLIVGFIPGLGGNFLLALLIPMTVGMDLVSAFALLLGGSAVTDIGGSITAILFATPGTGKNVATVFDGFALAKQGKAGVALGAAITSSLVAGVLGAFFLMISVMVIRPLVLLFGPAEVFALSLLGVTAVSSMLGKKISKGLLMGLLGILLSLVGENASTGTIRLSFGLIYLWDGVPLIPVMLGLFAITEIIHLGAQGGSLAETSYLPKQISRHVLEGSLAVFSKFWLTVKSTLIGLWIGILPGLGGQAAAFFAYGYAAKTSEDPQAFGTGIVDGVIASEAANSSEGGGALVTTLAFGIPGNTSNALLLGAFILFGLAPGPSMLKEHLSFVFSLSWILVFSTVLASLISLFCCKHLVKLTFLKGSILVPFVLVFVLLGSYTTSFDFGDMVVAIIFGLFGYWMKVCDYPAAPLLLGLVLGPMIEKNMLLAYDLFGIGFLGRPITLLLLFCNIFLILLPIIHKGSLQQLAGKESKE